MKLSVKRAFLAVRGEWSPDRVVADPDINPRFLAEVRRLGVALNPRECNRILLNLRKAGRLRGLKSHRTSFADQDEYEFAAEIAVRFLERRDGVTLDNIICDPTWVTEFDSLADQLSAGFTPLQYRWAALSLRKNRGLRPEPLAHVVPIESATRVSIKDMAVDMLPEGQAVYLFYSPKHLLYIGETTDLRSRLRKHREHSDNRSLARWMWEEPDSPLFVEFYVLPSDTPTRVRKAVELELIRSRGPEFNVKR